MSHLTPLGNGDEPAGKLAEMSWSEIERPGSYLLVDSGDLVRIPAQAIAPGRSPVVTLTSVGGTRVALLSTNAAEPTQALRTLAARHNYFVNF